MIRLSQIARVLHINIVFAKHGLDEVIFATHLFRPFRFMLYLLPWNWLPVRRRTTQGERIRLALEELGPIFVKFGQILSTRRDLLSDEIASELVKLQDSVKPFSSRRAQEIIERAYGCSIDEVFLEFDPTPLAAASIAQVHAAKLHDGTDVIVKVVRPDIKKVINRDIALMYTLADLAERYWKEGRRLRPRAVVAEFEKTILGELDLMREAANASQLRRNFESSELLYVPEIYWDYTRRNVMVMERISGVAVDDIESLKNNNIELKQLSERGVEIFFTQVFRDNFFHADMHPGNIFVSPQGKYIAIDFGIMGTLTVDDQRYLAENFLAFFNRDYYRVAELHVQSGWVPEDTRISEFESAIRSVCEPIFERPLKDISFGRLLLHLFQTARRFNMEVQPQLVLLQKTLLNIEGLGRQLYPDLDLWQTAKPFLEGWMKDQLGPSAMLRELKKDSRQWAKTLPQLPGMVYDLLKKANNGQLEVHYQSDALDKIHRQLRASQRSQYLAIIAAAMIISSALLIGLDGYQPLMLGSLPLLSWVLGGLGFIMLVASWPASNHHD